MKNYKKTFATIIQLILATFLFSGCAYFPKIYLADDVYGTVVDEETGEPISDVIVLIYWELSGGVFHPQTEGYLVFEEAVTDVNGDYKFSAWGPKLTVSGYVNDSNPFLKFYKRGYEMHTDFNEGPRLDDGYVFQSDSSGEAIRLKKFNGSTLEYSRYVSARTTLLNSHTFVSNCYWENVPRISAEMINLSNYFIDQGLEGPFYRHLGRYSYSNCNDPKIVLKDYLDE